MIVPSESRPSIQEHGIHPYPLVRSAGLFLAIIGAGILANIAINGAFIVAVMLAVLSLLFAKALALGKPVVIQIIALALAIVLEIVLLIIMVNVLPMDTSSQNRLMWVLIIVGIHFLPMAVCFGPRLLMVGLLCIINGALGLSLNNLSSDLFLLTDGALKLGFGLWLFKKP